MPFLFALHFTARPFADSGGCLCSQLCLMVQSTKLTLLMAQTVSAGRSALTFKPFCQAYSIFNNAYVKLAAFYLLWNSGV